MDTLAMRFNNVFADGQSESCTAFITAAGCIGTVKAFKDAVQVLFPTTTYTVVTNFNQYVFVVGFVNAINWMVPFSVYHIWWHSLRGWISTCLSNT